MALVDMKALKLKHYLIARLQKKGVIYVVIINLIVNTKARLNKNLPSRKDSKQHSEFTKVF